MTNSIDDFTKADCTIVIGSNTTEQHPLVATRIIESKLKGGKLYVIDPRRIQLADYADLYAPIQPGTNLALINAMIYIIIAEGLTDEKFVEERLEGYEELLASVGPEDIDMAVEVTGLTEEMIREMAIGYATAKNGSIAYTMGVTQHITGSSTVAALANLAMITGNVGKEGAGVNPLRGQNNVQGSCDMGAVPAEFPGYQKATDEAVHEKFRKKWGTDVSCKIGYKLTEIFGQVLHGDMKGLFIIGENPVMSDPNAAHVVEALEKTEFVVVQDIFMTETAELADVVLPGASFVEKDGTFANTERRVQRVRKVIEPVGNAKADWELLRDVIQLFGVEANYDHPSDVMAEINEMTTIYGGITYERIDDVGIQWPCPSVDHPGTPYMHKDVFSRGKGLITINPYIPPSELPTEEYPFLMTTGRIHHHYHTGTMTRRVWNLEREASKSFIEINEVDAKEMGLWDFRKVKVSTKRGSLETEVRITNRIGQGVVFMPFHFKESLVNALSNDSELDPLAKIPQLKSFAVRIEVL